MTKRLLDPHQQHRLPHEVKAVDGRQDSRCIAVSEAAAAEARPCPDAELIVRGYRQLARLFCQNEWKTALPRVQTFALVLCQALSQSTVPFRVKKMLAT